MRVLARFLLSATSVDHFPPPALPEIAFLGRSNVGKSSVINSLLGAKVARTSNTPGRTQSINFFEVRWPGKPSPELLFADLPGYGYARVPKAVTRQWPEFIDPYLLDRPSLALCIALIDIGIPLQASDRQLIEFLGSSNRPFRIVATKSDRLSGNQLHKALDGLSREYAGTPVWPFSARTGDGRDQLWQEIRQAAASHSQPRFEPSRSGNRDDPS